MLFGNIDPEEISVQKENIIYKTNNKYSHDFYHKEQPEQIDKLITIDIDLKFR